MKVLEATPRPPAARVHPRGPSQAARHDSGHRGGDFAPYGARAAATFGVGSPFPAAGPCGSSQNLTNMPPAGPGGSGWALGHHGRQPGAIGGQGEGLGACRRVHLGWGRLHA
jgi:hypothetical protein